MGSPRKGRPRPKVKTTDAERDPMIRMLFKISKYEMTEQGADAIVGKFIMDAHVLHHRLGGDGLFIDKLDVRETPTHTWFDIILRPNPKEA